MSYAELIQQRLQSLSPAQQAEVFDFVEFLASRKATALKTSEPALPLSPNRPWLPGRPIPSRWPSSRR
jgi:hypothetical protein